MTTSVALLLGLALGGVLAFVGMLIGLAMAREERPMQEIVLREGETLTPLRLKDVEVVVFTTERPLDGTGELIGDLLRDAGWKGVLFVLQTGETLEGLRVRQVEAQDLPRA